MDPASNSANARDRILVAAGSLFYREGIHATGVERIAQEAGVSKRTMYQHFPSKTQLVEEYLRRYPRNRRDAQREGRRHGRRKPAQPPVSDLRQSADRPFPRLPFPQRGRRGG